MNEQEFLQKLKGGKIISIIILAIASISIIVDFSSENINTFSIASATFQMLLVLGSIIGCNSHMIYGPICGAIVAILMILSFAIIDIIIGILFLKECIVLVKYMQK